MFIFLLGCKKKEYNLLQDKFTCTSSHSLEGKYTDGSVNKITFTYKASNCNNLSISQYIVNGIDNIEYTVEIDEANHKSIGGDIQVNYDTNDVYFVKLPNGKSIIIRKI